MDAAVDKRARYELALQQLTALTQDERHLIANLANVTALLKETLTRASWVGFYLREGPDLVLGPFQGAVACARIGPGRGVCGAAMIQRQTLVVDDVHAFPGHIACDARARSEIVVPVLRRGEVVAVLDVDSHEPRAFDSLDRECLERAATLVAAFDWPEP